MAIEKVYLRDPVFEEKYLKIGGNAYITSEISTITNMRWTEINQFVRVDTANGKILYVPRENVAMIEDN